MKEFLGKNRQVLIVIVLAGLLVLMVFGIYKKFFSLTDKNDSDSHSNFVNENPPVSIDNRKKLDQEIIQQKQIIQQKKDEIKNLKEQFKQQNIEDSKTFQYCCSLLTQFTEEKISILKINSRNNNDDSGIIKCKIQDLYYNAKIVLQRKLLDKL